MRRTKLTSLALAGALLLSACGSDGDDAPAEAAESAAASSDGITIIAKEFSFEPADFSLPADEDVELTLDNHGVVEHDIVVEELDDRELVLAPASESVTETVSVPAGTYTFYCSIPGHRDGGMEGTLTVE